MGFLSQVYNMAPLPLQNAMISAYGYYWQRRRFGGIFEKEYVGFKQRELYSKDDWDRYTNNKLKEIALHAYNNVPFYRERWQQFGINEGLIKAISIDTIHTLPLLEKSDLRKYCKGSMLANNKERNGSFFASSGTTGTPVNILFSEAMHQRWSAAFEARIRNWAGLSRKDSRGMIGGRRIISTVMAKPPFYRYNIFEKQVYFSAYHLSLKNIASYWEGLSKHKPAYMTGYAVSNYLMALFLKESGLKADPLKAVITSSEKLTTEMRALLQEVYQCKAYDSYSGVEACGLISECEEGSLHISPDIGLIEILNEKGKQAREGEWGELVCTGFLNYDQPLIRYRIGDHALVGKDGCKCGRHMPVIKEISGRDEDIITTTDGREMVRFHGIFIDLPTVLQGQVVQETIRDFIVNVVSSEELKSEEQTLIIQRMKSQLGNDIKVRIQQVDEILPGPNGKFKAVVSKI